MLSPVQPLACHTAIRFGLATGTRLVYWLTAWQERVHKLDLLAVRAVALLDVLPPHETHILYLQKHKPAFKLAVATLQPDWIMGVFLAYATNVVDNDSCARLSAPTTKIDHPILPIVAAVHL